MREIEKQAFDELISSMTDAVKVRSLNVFVGAGVSIAQGYPNWDGYVDLLISYWMSHLIDLVKLKETKSQSLTTTDIQALRDTSNSHDSKKRKIDKVRYLIYKYCETGDVSATNRLYEQHELDFEKFYFNEVSPSGPINRIIESLVKLNANYLTTNYDKQIEQTYEQLMGGFPIVVSGLKNVKTKYPLPTVIHLHGTPEGECDEFVGSAKDYAHVYYQNDFAQNVINLVNQDRSVLLFIGCSMDEDEILSIVQQVKDSTKCYAIMLKNQSDSKNEFNKRFYKEWENINVVWYGNKYEDLPDFVEKLVDAVLNSLEDKPMDYDHIKEVMMNGLK